LPWRHHQLLPRRDFQHALQNANVERSSALDVEKSRMHLVPVQSLVGGKISVETRVKLPTGFWQTPSVALNATRALKKIKGGRVQPHVVPAV